MPDDLYHRDILAWSQAQAERLRRMAAGEKVNDLDWDNLIEEVESVGRSQVQAVESPLLQALIHAMKAAAWPGHEAARHWRGEIRILLINARKRFTPSMRQLLDVTALHADALEAVRDAEMDTPPGPLRDGTDLTLDELLSREVSLDALISRLRAP
jgi:hypothetical protein